MNGSVQVLLRYMIRKLWRVLKKIRINTYLYNPYDLCRMMLNNFKMLRELISNDDNVIFVIYGRLIDNKFALSPDTRNITVALSRAMENVSNKLNFVPRWLRTTNIRCPYVQNLETGDMHLPHTYYAANHIEQVVDVKKQCYDAIEKITDRLKSTAQK